ncbi:MAG: hypothetical protein IJY27_07800 [Clostridia bacterium]|nr:hypothetical protein [Clostridia bacterium]
MQYFIAIDAGGTKTEGVLFDETGKIHKKSLLAGANPNDIGVDAAVVRLASVLDELKSAAPTQITAAFAGVAGAVGHGEALERALGQRTGIKALRVASDAVPLLTGALGSADGACLIAGTGSVCFVRHGGELTRIGGWGYLLDPSCSGSGFDLGRDALTAALHAHDGQGTPTLLTDLLTSRLGKHPADAIPDIYAGGRAYIASLASIVFEGAEANDTVSLCILRRNCEGLAKMLTAAMKVIKPPFGVALGGGIFEKFPIYARMLSHVAPAGIELAVADTPAVYGAAVEAVLRTGKKPPSDFKACFMQTYKY